jgi:hypothetical protein
MRGAARWLVRRGIIGYRFSGSPNVIGMVVVWANKYCFLIAFIWHKYIQFVGCAFLWK